VQAAAHDVGREGLIAALRWLGYTQPVAVRRKIVSRNACKREAHRYGGEQARHTRERATSSPLTSAESRMREEAQCAGLALHFAVVPGG
jgi:hypothetical protein